MAEILILEDDLELSNTWARALRAVGYKVELVTDSTSALAAMKERRFDLVVVDVFIKKGGQFVPDGGVLLLAKIRRAYAGGQANWWRTVPVLAVSGGFVIEGGFDPLKTAADMGATEWLRKPIPMDELIYTIRRMLGDAAAEARRAVAGE